MVLGEFEMFGQFSCFLLGIPSIVEDVCGANCSESSLGKADGIIPTPTAGLCPNNSAPEDDIIVR